MKIGVFDSGKGGTLILNEIKKLLPNEDYLYIGDSKNCPYGEKTDEELMAIVKGIVDRFVKWGAKLIVIACNTATTRCISQLRKDYPNIQFVGTEPAIKLAAKSDARKILVMATPGTIDSERTARLLEENKKDNQVIDLLACNGLADVIETNGDVDKKLRGLLNDSQKDYDKIVLGCTHYSLVKANIQKFFPAAELIDGNKAVANRVKKLIES
ncbi:glutamate racemase [Candidatus Saccharibacteria bacterium]|nr:glutamate racemase [Candidatus Saccharibacteria bacterium]